MTELKLKYNAPAEDTQRGWDSYSLPLGNGYMGVSLFNGVEKDRLQITENSYANPPKFGGLTYPTDLYFEFPHEGYGEYERGLDLNAGKAYTKYTFNGVEYTREYFTSYPDKVLVIRLTASKPASLSFTAGANVPYIRSYAEKRGDGGGRRGRIKAKSNTVTIKARLNYYNVRFEGQIRVFPVGGEMKTNEKSVEVINADSAVIIFGCATNYELTSNVFSNPDPKKKIPDVDPHGKVQKIMSAACRKSYDRLYKNHFKDYNALFGRVSLDLTTEYDSAYTDEILQAYRDGKKSKYLEQLFFQYGRYLLICSSRKGCLPAHLQGIWNALETSPWGSGYWHNVNQQMNYWPAFNTNLIELFDSYIDFNEAFREEGSKYAAEYVKHSNPASYTDKPGECGWVVSTPCWAYQTLGIGEHSGPMTCGFTTQMFWDAYAFSQDEDMLKKHVYPALYSLSKMHTKAVSDYDGYLYCKYSDSQEQETFDGRHEDYNTIGSPSDQSMIWENGRDLLLAAEILGKDDKLIKLQREQMPLYNPIEVGWSGQIKEYREEHFYGEIGEYEHRHMSHLLGLYPGNLINRSTPAWLDAAKVSLRERGWLKQGGWALAQRTCAWARVGDAEKAYTMYNWLLTKRIAPNLWNSPLYQIDGNFGGTAGVAEMLLQSHESHIVILPALPDEWKDEGSYKGLTARGAFVVDVNWKNGTAKKIVVTSKKGRTCRLSYGNISLATVKDGSGNTVDFTVDGRDMISFETKTGCKYTITGIKALKRPQKPEELDADKKTMTLTWKTKRGLTYNVYRAFDSAPDYEQIADGLQAGKLTDMTAEFDKHDIVTYKVTSVSSEGVESDGVTFTVNHATKREIELYNRYVHHIF